MAHEALIVSSVRSPIAKAGTEKRKGTLSLVRPDDLMAQVLLGALAKVPTLPQSVLEDIIVGTSFPEGEQGFNIGRILSICSGLPRSVTGQTVNRFCASGLQAIVTGSAAVAQGYNAAVVAGGVESMTRIPMGGSSFLPNPLLTVPGGDTYMDMGMTAENVAKAFGISREDQDAMAYRSHMRAIAAQESGRQAGHIIPLTFERTTMVDGTPTAVTISLTQDEGPRKDTSIASLAKLRPAFLFDGTGSVTAGNSSQVSDGGAVTIIVNRDIANQYGLVPLARLVSFATAGNEPGLMGVAPIWAIPKALEKAGLSIADIGLFGLNEAFAAQWLAIQRTLNLNPEIVNVNGGAIAIGHPLGCTGARDTADTLHEAILRGVRYFGVGMCVGGGQGAFAVFENLTIQ